MKKFKKCLCFVLALVCLTGVFAGCQNEKVSDGKVEITIAAWPIEENDKAKYDLYENYKAQFEELYPNVKIKTDEWNFDLKTYLVRAVGDDLPTVFRTAPTELSTLVESNYIKDITPYMEKYGYLEKYDESYSHLYTVDGKCYAMVEPNSVYKMGMVYNRDLFTKAGLVDENGIPTYPKTWDEVTEMSVKIKEATGKPGYVIATKDRIGGWHFMNIARSYGAEFVKKDGDGWKAVFASPECEKALQWIKDMKWKYDVLQEDLLINNWHIGRFVGTGEAAMGIDDSSFVSTYPKNFGADRNAVAMSRMPAGPEGRTALSSGNIWVFSEKATDEEIEAVFNWFDFIGEGPTVSDELVARWDEKYKVSAAEEIVGISQPTIWKDEEINKKRNETMSKYINIEPKFFEDYALNDDVNFAFDPEKCAQECYDILDAAIQQVLTDKNADVKAVLKKAQDDFQKNHLDNAE